jgi:hypothetical protein
VTRWTVERAKLTVDGAHIGVVDVAINEVGDLTWAMHGNSTLVSRSHELMKRCFVVQLKGIFGRKAKLGCLTA